MLEGQLDFLIHAPNERWYRGTFHDTGMATRLAIAPRNKEGQAA